MESIHKGIVTIAPWVLYGMIITLPFSIACGSMSLVAMSFLILTKLFLNRGSILENLKPLNHLVWIAIPVVYLISLSYSKNLTRGWSQWLILLPLFILPLFFEVFTFKKYKSKIELLFTASCTLAVLLHLVPMSFWNSMWIKSSAPLSLFFTPLQNSWIWWSALLSLILKRNKIIWDQMMMIILVIGLMYFGQLGLLFIGYVLYLIAEWSNDRDEWAEVLTRITVFLPAFFIIGWICFDSFQGSARNFGYSLLSLYTKEEVLGPINWYFTDMYAAWTQWWLHPFSGVGLGDYTDAVWNQYLSIGKESPVAPFSQLGHFMVSSGIAGLVTLFFIYRNYSSANRKIKSLVILLLAALIFYAPFISQVSSMTFLLPLLISSIQE